MASQLAAQADGVCVWCAEAFSRFSSVQFRANLREPYRASDALGLSTRRGPEVIAMRRSLRPGGSRVKRIASDLDRTISFMGEESRVYATPRLVSDIEYTCRELILEHADPGEDSVGMEIALKHLAPSLPGMTVEISVRIA